MPITRWEPFALDLPERWRRLFDFNLENDGWLRVEELHEDGALVVRAELPGIDPDKDVEVTVSDDVLHIAATRTERTEQKEKKSYRSEFRYGTFSRDLVLPAGVDGKDVKASYADGILEIRIPWPAKQETKPERVLVSRG